MDDIRTKDLPKGRYWEYMDAINPYKNYPKEQRHIVHGVECIKHRKKYYRLDNGLPLEIHEGDIE